MALLFRISPDGGRMPVEQASQHVAVHALEGFDIGLRIHFEADHGLHQQGESGSNGAGT
ncbi:hypothetical protein P3T23_009401 [Paraburkholderia sp. GAS448]|uniref:hypothetical protein n=1 Tax=Paraburkholderia sp. GAS448 TaxID=3035136 RepID=UPI003D1C9704